MKKFIFILVTISISANLFSQNITGFGKVISVSGILIPNAKITISPTADLNTIYEYICDKNGNYTFEFPENGNDYVFTISPSNQTLQFTIITENKNLTSGSNEILLHQVNLNNSNGIKLNVVDISGNPVSGAKVEIYDTQRKWRVDSCSIAKAVYTDANGIAEIKSLLPIEYWFNIDKNYNTNRFTTKKTASAIDTTQTTNIDITIRDLTQNELYLSGLCDNKTWITDSMIIFGSSQPYDADSKLLSDGTWWDSNGNHGFWWFNLGETTMTYDYDTNSTNGGGSQVEATNLIITDTSFIGDMDMSGLAVTYYMHAEYDTINLLLSAQDTTLYLEPGETIVLNEEDLFLNSSYCFTCNTSLSQNTFSLNETGINQVILTMEDRCGNTAIDTINVTVVAVDNVENIPIYGISLYPNPAKDYFVVESDNQNIESIKIMDITGKMVKELELNKAQSTIDVSLLKQGVYFIEIVLPNNLISKKLIIE